MAITPYTVMLYERDRTVCAPFVPQNVSNKTILLHNSNSIFIPMDETVDVDVVCACNNVIGELKKFTPLVTLLKQGLLVKKVRANSEENKCIITIKNVGISHVQIAKKQPIGYLDMSLSSTIIEDHLVIPELAVSYNSTNIGGNRGAAVSKPTDASAKDVSIDYFSPDYTVDIEDDVIEQNVVIDPTNLDKKTFL
jgi:hypothetical protein